MFKATLAFLRYNAFWAGLRANNQDSDRFPTTILSPLNPKIREVDIKLHMDYLVALRNVLNSEVN